VIFNDIKFVKDKKTGYYLSSKAVRGDYRERLHVYVWKYHKGLDSIPKGYVVHHIDENKDNNDITNLELMLLAAHMSLHNSNNPQLANLKLAQEKAKEWHKSEEGRKWHKGQSIYLHNRVYIKECAYCHKEFEAKSNKAKYCHQNCKMKDYRLMGMVP
jgi:hypothetical protein